MRDYSRHLFKELEEQTKKAERLESGNRALRRTIKDLRDENERLNQRLDMLEINFTVRVEAAVEMALMKAMQPLQETIHRQNETIKKQSDEIVRLKGIINKDSSNSSKPPSSNGFNKPAVNSRERSGKKPGGQPGHSGHSLTKPKNWEELVEKELAREDIQDHTQGSERYVTRCVLDIEEIRLKWTEHRYQPGAAELREQPQPVVYGENIKALAILLEVNHVPRERACEFLDNITHGAIKLSEGTFNRIIRRFSEKLDGELSVIETDLLNGLVQHTDETPMKSTQWEEPVTGAETGKIETAEKTSALVYIRTHSNARSTLLTVNKHKDMEGVERDGILTRFHGILSHDHDKKFYHYGSEHATCCEHLKRDLKGIADGYNCEWASVFRRFLSEMNAYKKADIQEHARMPEGCGAERFLAFSIEYDKLLKHGQEAMNAETNQYARNELRKILERLREYKDCYLLFMKNYKAPFTNNQAERDLRPCKGKQKVSGCFRSWAGIVAYARLRSFFSTLRKRGLNILPAIRMVFCNIPVLPALSAGCDL
jgi:hypothetical protein